QFTVRDTRRDKEGVVAANKLIGLIDIVELQAGVDTALALLIGGGSKSALDEAAQRLDGGRGCDALGAAPDAHAHVDAALVAGRVDAASDISIEHEAGAGAGCPDLVDQFGVARPVEHRDAKGPHILAERFRERPHVLADGLADVYDADALGSGDDLLHVEDR